MKNLLRYVLEGRADRQYRERGFYVFRKALPFGEVQTLADLARDLISYPGEILRQNGELAANEFFPGTQIVRNPVLNAHLPISEAMKPIHAALGAIITSPALAARLRELDGAEHYTIHQTLLFFAAQTTGLHLDSWALDTSPRGFAHTLWIPLQDMNFKSGLPCVIPWPQGKVVTEAELGWTGEGPYGERYDHYQQALSEKLFGDSPEVAASLVRKGDFIVWSSLTAALQPAVAAFSNRTSFAAGPASPRPSSLGEFHRPACRSSDQACHPHDGPILLFHLRRYLPRLRHCRRLRYPDQT